VRENRAGHLGTFAQPSWVYFQALNAERISLEEVDDPPLLAPMDHWESDSQVLKHLKAILGGVLVVAGWFGGQHGTSRARTPDSPMSGEGMEYPKGPTDEKNYCL
jgi:hypothetical protein